VVIAALMHAFDPAPFRRLWLLKRDLSIAVAAAIGVLAFGVLNGMLFAIALSLAALIHRLATPHVARLGRLGDSHNFVDISRHEGAVATPHIVIWRPTEPLFFANAERIFGSIAIAMRGETGVRATILSLEESFDLDSTALETLIEFDNAMRAQKIRVQLARAHDQVRDLLARSTDTDLQSRCSFSVDDAVEALRPFIADPEVQGET
jgi:MFS superfamily sulfate permease-like transporter